MTTLSLPPPPIHFRFWLTPGHYLWPVLHPISIHSWGSVASCLCYPLYADVRTFRRFITFLIYADVRTLRRLITFFRPRFNDWIRGLWWYEKYNLQVNLPQRAGRPPSSRQAETARCYRWHTFQERAWQVTTLSTIHPFLFLLCCCGVCD